MDSFRIKILQRNLQTPLLIKKKENLLYLTGRSFMQGYLLVKKHGVIFFGDGLEKIDGFKTNRLKNIGLYLGKAQSLQLEEEFTFAEYKYLKSKVKGRKLKIFHAKSPVDYQRAIKDESEVRLIKKSMQIVGRVFDQVKKQLKNKTWTEIRLAEFIKQAGFKLGAEDIAFPPIVASGPNAAVPHHVPSSKRLKAGESVIIDFGFKYQGYCSDFTRTVFIKKVSSQLERIYNQVEKTYLESISFAKAGVRADVLYKKSVGILAEKHLDKYFIHNLGHGSGLEIHELPNLSPISKDILKENMVFSIEPGVYISNLGGVRIEDLVYLKKDRVCKFINTPTRLSANVFQPFN